MTPIQIKQPEQILEYYRYNLDVTTIVVGYQNEIFLGSEKDMWILPGKTYLIPTAVKCWYPNGNVGLTMSCSWMTNINVIPQIHTDDCEIFLKVRNAGLLPTKIHAGKMFARLIVIPKTECHIVHTKGQS